MYNLSFLNLDPNLLYSTDQSSTVCGKCSGLRVLKSSSSIRLLSFLIMAEAIDSLGTWK